MTQMFENAGTPLADEGIDEGELLGLDVGTALDEAAGEGAVTDATELVGALPGTQAAATTRAATIVDA